MARPTQRILCIGGGGFFVDDEQTVPSPIHRKALELTGEDRPRVCFLPTASGDAAGYIENFAAGYGKVADVTIAALFKREIADLRSHLLAQDFIYVGGGSTANLLAVWRVHGVDAILRECYDAGVLLGGLSAGMLCWFECSLTDSFGGAKPLRDGLGLLAGSGCPHYHGEALRRPALLEAVAGGQLPATLAVDDHAAVLFEGGKLRAVWSELDGAAAYQISADKEQTLSPTMLPPVA